MNLEFDVNLKCMMLFFEHFFYETAGKKEKPTARMVDIHNRMVLETEKA